MRRTNMMLAMSALLATMAALPGSAAFSSSLPSHMRQLRTGAFCKGPPPLNFLKRRVNSEGVAGFKMELLGKRYWMWNVSEWAFDKFIALTQVVIFTLYGFIARLLESPYDESRLKAIRRRIAELRANRGTQGDEKNALDMMDIVWEVGAADAKISDKRDVSVAKTDASESSAMDKRYAFSFSILAIPAVIQFMSFINDDLYLKAVANASVWLVMLAVFVDWAAGSPAGVATNVKKALPVPLRKTLNIINSKSVFFDGQRSAIPNESWRSENYLKDV